MNMNTAEKNSRCVTSPEAITIKYSPNIQWNITLKVIFGLLNH